MNYQLTLPIPLNYQATLVDFCWGNNRLLQQQLTLTLQGLSERVLYFWGHKGCGKSHLLQACCHEKGPEAVYLPLSLLKQWGPQTIEGLDKQLLIAIDDISMIAKDPGWEEALFHLYNNVYDNGKTILLIASNKKPRSLSLALPDLRSRLAASLVMPILDLSDDLKLSILQQKAFKRGFELPKTVALFLLNHCARNLAELDHVLDRLDAASLAAHRKITIPFVKAILRI